MTGPAASVTVEPVTTEAMHQIIDSLDALDTAARDLDCGPAAELIKASAEHLAAALAELDQHGRADACPH